jgi:hypothetical protein
MKVHEIQIGSEFDTVFGLIEVASIDKKHNKIYYFKKVYPPLLFQATEDFFKRLISGQARRSLRILPRHKEVEV